MRKKEKAAPRPRYGFQLKVSKLLLFNRDPKKVVGFVTAYKLYIRIRMREEMIEEQIY